MALCSNFTACAFSPLFSAHYVPETPSPSSAQDPFLSLILRWAPTQPSKPSSICTINLMVLMPQHYHPLWVLWFWLTSFSSTVGSPHDYGVIMVDGSLIVFCLTHLWAASPVVKIVLFISSTPQLFRVRKRPKWGDCCPVAKEQSLVKIALDRPCVLCYGKTPL